VSTVVNEIVQDAAEFLDGEVDDLLSFLDDVAALGNEAAPTPSAELARLLAGTPALRQVRPAHRPSVPRPVRVRRRVAGLAAAAVAGLSVTGAAAVANELPPSMQRAVAHFAEHYLPFSLPRPVGDPPVGEPSLGELPAGGVLLSPGTGAQGGDAPVATGHGRAGASEASPGSRGPGQELSVTSGQPDAGTTAGSGGTSPEAASQGYLDAQTPVDDQQPAAGTGAPAGSTSDLQGSTSDLQGSSSDPGAVVGSDSAAGSTAGSDTGSGSGSGSSAGSDTGTGSVTTPSTVTESDASADADAGDADEATKGRSLGARDEGGPVTRPDPVPSVRPTPDPATRAGRAERGPVLDPQAQSVVRRLRQLETPAATPTDITAEASTSGTPTDGASPDAG
jgi:hypothetical protein